MFLIARGHFCSQMRQKTVAALIQSQESALLSLTSLEVTITLYNITTSTFSLLSSDSLFPRHVSVNPETELERCCYCGGLDHMI